MKMKFKGLKQKCLDEKYYEALKYMSHILSGEDRTKFIKQICKHNVYLGAICATTCEYDKKTDQYIKSILNGYFDEKQVTYYDKKAGQTYTYKKSLGKADMERFVMASYEIGNFKAIKWVVHTYEISINTLVRVGQKISEVEFVDFLNAVSKSINFEKMKMLCRIRTVPSQKNNEQAKKLLKFWWYKDRQIFTYLADSFGWLPDLDSNKKYGEMIYAKCFEGVDNSIAFNNVIINAINVDHQEGLERLFRIINYYGEEQTKKNLYMLFYMKLQKKYPIYKGDYKALECVKVLDNREVYLGYKTIQDVLYHNYSSWVNVFELIYYFPRRDDINVLRLNKKSLSVKTEELTRNTYPLNRYLENYPETTLEIILYSYFNSSYAATIYLDDFIMLISEHYKLSIKDVCVEINNYPDVGHVFQKGRRSYFRNKYRTLAYPVTESPVDLGKDYQILYEDYDYINHRFYVSVKNI